MEYTVTVRCSLGMHINGFIVYALCDARTHQVRYIGSSELGLSRPVTIQGYQNQPDIYAWLRDLAVCGSEHIVLVLAVAPTTESLRSLEAYWIGLGLHFGWPLLNKRKTGKIEDPDQLIPPGKRWNIQNWRRDPEVKAKLRAAKEKRSQNKRKN